MSPTPTSFLKDVKTHVMEVLREDGVYRHIRFKRPGTICYYFDLITWPGFLCYTGDMGTFVFYRTKDMFDFFRPHPDRKERFSIDFRYWAEKVQAGDRCSGGDGIYEFDGAAFKREIGRQKGQLALKYRSKLDDDQFEELMEALDDVRETGEYDSEQHSIAAVHNFDFAYLDKESRLKHVDLDTDDFPSCKTYTYRFTWCCYALVWAIEQYDQAKLQKNKEEITA